MKKLFLSSVAAVVLTISVSGCAGGTNDVVVEEESSPAGNGETPISTSPAEASQDGKNGERVLISEVELELEIKPQDTQGMVEQLKTVTAEHGGYITGLITSMYEIEEEETKEEAEEETEDGETKETEGMTEVEEEDSYYGYDDYNDYYDYYDDYYGKSSTLWTKVDIIVPEDQADEVIQQVTERYKVTNRSDSIEDYTIQYQNLTKRVADLEEEKQRLTAILEDIRSSGKVRTSEGGSEFLEKMINLENNLWSVTNELNTYRYGDGDYYSYRSYYYFSGSSLAAFEDRKGKTLIEISVYVNDEEES